MKFSDVQKLKDDGLISEDQRKSIVERYSLEENSSRFLAIVCIVGAALIASGAALLIASHWGAIPRGFKIALGLLLMLGAHLGGWKFRTSAHPKIAEALHLIGACLFLANIALVGQVYNLSARPSNAFLLWFLGIVLFPWILRSKPMQVLVLVSFCIWFGGEAAEADSLIHLSAEGIALSLGLISLVYLDIGYLLRSSSLPELAHVTEGVGLLGTYFFLIPLTWGIMDWRTPVDGTSVWIVPALLVLSLASIGIGVSRLERLSPSWRLLWGLALAVCVALIACTFYASPVRSGFPADHGFRMHWAASAVILAFSLVQIQVALRERASWLVNFAVIFIAADIVSTYIALLGTMAKTGATFLFTGIFLLALGWVLERNRRALMRRIEAP